LVAGSCDVRLLDGMISSSSTHSAPMQSPRFIDPITPDPPVWTGRTVLRQRWSDLAYFHWRYEPEVVQRLLPDGVRVDTFDGSAWVGLIPFETQGVQLGPTPPVPWLGSFIEINVRTYVVDALGRRSVWFFSLDVPRSAIVAVARTVFSLPYCWARAEHIVHGGAHRYRMRRRWPRAASVRAEIGFRVAEGLQADEVSDLDHFLCARWALVTSRRDELLYGRVHHRRWELQTVDRVSIDQTVVQAAGLPAPIGEPHGRYSPGVDVEIAWFEKIRPRTTGGLTR
jgi:hypothetical protein